jgi:hypothetical protein
MVRGEQPFWISRYSRNSAINDSRVISRFYISRIASVRKSYSLRNNFMLIPFRFDVKCLPVFKLQARAIRSTPLANKGDITQALQGCKRLKESPFHPVMRSPCCPTPRSLSILLPSKPTRKRRSNQPSKSAKDINMYPCLFHAPKSRLVERV